MATKSGKEAERLAGVAEPILDQILTSPAYLLSCFTALATQRYANIRSTLSKPSEGVTKQNRTHPLAQPQLLFTLTSTSTTQLSPRVAWTHLAIFSLAAPIGAIVVYAVLTRFWSFQHTGRVYYKYTCARSRKTALALQSGMTARLLGSVVNHERSLAKYFSDDHNV